MATSRRPRRAQTYPFPLEALPKGRICFSIVLSFPFHATGTVSRQQIADAIVGMGFVPEGGRFGISLIVGSVKDVVAAGVARELREREERERRQRRTQEAAHGVLMIHDEAAHG